MGVNIEIIGDNEYTEDNIAATVSIEGYVTVIGKNRKNSEVELTWVEDDVSEKEYKTVLELFKQNKDKIERKIK